MKAYKIISLVAFFISAYCLHAQTFIEAGTGVRFSHVDGYSEDFPMYGIVPQNGFEERSPIFNIGVVQTITNKLSLKTALQFGVQTLPFSDFGFVGWTDLRFDHYNFSFLPHYAIFKNMEIGAGINYVLLSDFEFGKKDRNIWHPAGVANNDTAFGWTTSLSYNLRPLTITLQYKNTNMENNEKNISIYQIKSIEVMLSYQLQVGK